MDPFSRHPKLGDLAKPVRTWALPVRKAGDVPDRGSAISEEEYKWLHDIADGAVPAVQRAFREAVERVKGTVAERDLANAVATKSVTRVLHVLGLDEALPKALGEDFANAINGVIVDTAQSAEANQIPDAIAEAQAAAPAPPAGSNIQVVRPPRRISANLRFDVRNPYADQFLRNYDFNLIREVTQDQRETVQQTVLQAFREGGHPYEQAKRIRQSIGLTTRQTRTLDNYRAGLIAQDRKADQIDRMTAKYSAKLLKMRAETIARTETIRAGNAGQNAAWEAAVKDGLLNRNTLRRQWLVTLDDRLCPACAAVPLLNPDGVALGALFQTPYGPIAYPVLHPNCRCTVIIVAF